MFVRRVNPLLGPRYSPHLRTKLLPNLSFPTPAPHLSPILRPPRADLAVLQAKLVFLEEVPLPLCPNSSCSQPPASTWQSNLEAHPCPSEGSGRALNLGTMGRVCDPLYLWAGLSLIFLICKMAIIIETSGPLTNYMEML